MQSMSETFEEHHKRWSRVGQLCGVTLCGSPVSKSPPTTATSNGSTPRGDVDPEVLHQHLHGMSAHLRYSSQHNNFVHNRSVSELVHPSLYQHRQFASQSQMYSSSQRPHTLPRRRSLTPLQSPPTGSPFGDKKKSLATIEDMTAAEQSLVESVESMTSSSSSAPQTAVLSQQLRVGEGEEEQSDSSLRSLSSSADRESDRGSRESSIDGKGTLEKSKKKSATSMKLKSSPRNFMRNRLKRNTLSSKV